MFLQCQQAGSVASSHLKTTEWVLVVLSQTDFGWWGFGWVSEGKGQGSGWGLGGPGVSTIQMFMSL